MPSEILESLYTLFIMYQEIYSFSWQSNSQNATELDPISFWQSHWTQKAAHKDIQLVVGKLIFIT